MDRNTNINCIKEEISCEKNLMKMKWVFIFQIIGRYPHTVVSPFQMSHCMMGAIISAQ